MEENHLEIARKKFFEKILNKKSAGPTAFELEARRDPWDKKLLRDMRDFPRLLVHSMFHKQLKGDKKACVVTLFLYLNAPASLVAALEEVAAKSRRSQAARKTFEELVDFVYRDTSKEENTYFVEVYSKFKKKNVQAFRENRFVQFLVGYFRAHLFDEYLATFPSQEARAYISKRINDFHVQT